MKRFAALLLASALVLCLISGCGRTEIPPPSPEDPAVTVPEVPGACEEPAQPQPTAEEILWGRREAAEAYLREMTSVRWRSDTEVVYSYTDSIPDLFRIVAGRLYEGLPYSYAGCALGTWLDHPNTVDEKGVHTMQGLSRELLGGNSNYSRLGVDCSGTLCRPWQSVGARVRTESTNCMTPDYGFIRVGEYEAPAELYTSTREDCQKNGREVMFAAYSLLQKADGIVTYNGSGHARFVVKVRVVRDFTGAIDGDRSAVITVEQNTRMISGDHYFDESVGEDVYPCMTEDREYSFARLFEDGYLPVTNKVFVDPSPLEEPAIRDTVQTPDRENLFKGTVACSWALDHVAVTVTDAAGSTVQSSVLHPKRRTELAVEMSQFASDPESKLVGKIDLAALSSGTYRCRVTARTVAGHALTVREFDFAV